MEAKLCSSCLNSVMNRDSWTALCMSLFVVVVVVVVMATMVGFKVEIMNKMDVQLVGGKEENGIMLVGKCRLVTAKVVGVGAVRFLCVFENDVKKCL